MNSQGRYSHVSLPELTMIMLFMFPQGRPKRPPHLLFKSQDLIKLQNLRACCQNSIAVLCLSGFFSVSGKGIYLFGPAAPPSSRLSLSTS
jgi:hypothetical protein